MANPFLALVGTYVGGAGVAQSGFATFSFALTNCFEANIPIQINNPGTTSISAGAYVTIYRSADLGVTWETIGAPGFAFPRPPSASLMQRQTIFLTPGIYLISVGVGGGVASTWTAQALTAEVLSAYN